MFQSLAVACSCCFPRRFLALSYYVPIAFCVYFPLPSVSGSPCSLPSFCCFPCFVPVAFCVRGLLLSASKSRLFLCHILVACHVEVLLLSMLCPCRFLHRLLGAMWHFPIIVRALPRHFPCRVPVLLHSVSCCGPFTFCIASPLHDVSSSYGFPFFILLAFSVMFLLLSMLCLRCFLCQFPAVFCVIFLSLLILCLCRSVW